MSKHPVTLHLYNKVFKVFAKNVFKKLQIFS